MPIDPILLSDGLLHPTIDVDLMHTQEAMMHADCATMHSMDLEDLRYFLALTRYGTLSSAAERLGVEHTTVRRRVAALETSLGARLFDKTAQGWVLTSKGQRLLPYAQRIESESDNAQSVIGDRKHSPQGTVRIVANDAFGSSVIAPGVARLRQAHTAIDIEMVTTQELLNYGLGEFDIAVTVHRPERRGFKVTHLCDYDYRVYASAQYLATHPPISGPDDLAAQDMVWYVESLIELPEVPSAENIAAIGARIVFRTTNVFGLIEAGAAGVGLALVPSFLAHHDGRLEPVLHREIRVQRSYWLIVPNRLLNTERVSVVCEHLQETARLEHSRLVPPV
jgi:DNA-binding transcriptional LysR family regulator